MKYFILENGEPVEVPMLVWAKWFETDAKQLFYDEVPTNELYGGIWTIRSIFLGFDHTGWVGLPPLWETVTILICPQDEAYSQPRMSIERFSYPEDQREFHENFVVRQKKDAETTRKRLSKVRQ